MNRNLYLVSYIGIYRNSEGDHTHWLFDNRADAIKCFFKQKEDCLSYYNDETSRSFNLFYDELNTVFSLSTNDGEDRVDIYMTEISANGQMSQTVL